MSNKLTDDTAKSQRERFEEAARELGVELDEDKLREALRKVAPAVNDKNSPKKG